MSSPTVSDPLKQYECGPFRFADNDYYGIQERVFWVVCRKS